MTGVKWIKLSTNMFDDEKIRLIEGMPEADSILIIWVKLLSQAGKTNASGYIFLNENIPYTDEMLSTIFNRPLNVVRLALTTFKQFGMIEIDDNQFISISNWDKHQNTASLDKIREDTRKRVQRHREKQKVLGNEESNENVTLRNALRRRKKKEEEELEKEYIPYVEIVTYLNEKANKQYKSSSQATQRLINGRWNDGFRLDDFKTVIDKKVTQWLNDQKMNSYLRPQTLFGTKFESYLNEKGVKSIATSVYDNAF